ncbi:MAG: transcriptional regulator HexR [Pseudomonadales bacterium]|nr:transcriptional regulator HexR [Pseudomonadales bacterium]MDG1937869.1 transcriptional regulator HexR [Pseudomonadales bacterium]MDG2036324.1 transcriptional regulator HexR [Pseudomonadales bacterium]
MGLLQQLNNRKTFSKTAQQVADAILADPEAALSLPIAELARRASVSEPSVNRLCRSLGCKGYPDFKVKLSGELSSTKGKIARNIDFNDSVSDIVSKVFDSTHASLAMAQEACDTATLASAISMLTNAKAIYFFGHGASGSVALDAQHKFLRFKKPAIAHVDVLNQRIIATGLTKNDVAVFISYTGRTHSVIDAANIAATTEASIIGITSLDSPLANHCDTVLAVGNDEDTDMYTPMTSRIAQLSLIDILASGVALQMGGAFADHLLRVKASVAETKKPVL